MMNYEKQIAEIRACARSLLEQNKADVILGYTGGSLEGALIPFFARTPADADRLEWGDRCYQNLTPYLHGRTDRIGIAAKPCDVRGIVQYITEGQLKREQIHIIGIDCRGMVDAEGMPRPACAECRVHIPPIFDTHITDDRIRQTREPEDGTDHSAERFQREIDKCILCYSCRQACYGCYCKTCFAERDVPNWLPAEMDSGTKKTFHLGRAMHLAGRCIECGNCQAACASGVNLRYIIKELTRFVEAEYDYRAGMDETAEPPMTSYADDDREIGFWGEHEA